MKRTLVMSVCLLISGAVIYGFVDYMKTDKEQLDNLYKEEVTPVVKKEVKREAEPVETVEKETNAIVDEAKKSSVKKNVRIKKADEKIFLRVEDFSRARPVRKKDAVAAVDTVIIEAKENQ